MTDAYEFVAIGSGPAGESASELAAFFGHRSAGIEKARPGGTVTTAGGCPPRHCGRWLFTFPDSPKEASTVCGPRRRRRSLSISSANGRGKCAGCCKKEGPKNIARNHVDYI